jgi:CubicO group peptidase (beta-lactamase class C family)
MSCSWLYLSAFLTVVPLAHAHAEVAKATQGAPAPAYRSLEEKVAGWMGEYNVPAVGIGIIEDGELKYARVLGEREKGFPAPNNTIFNVASITKSVVAVLTLKLVEVGQWDLDEPLAKYWVDPDVASDPQHKILTTRHILTHQTGFANWRNEHPTRRLAFDFQPGTKYQYSGEGFEYLRRALEHKFGKPIEQLADSLLFTPLGMKDTHLSWDNYVDESRFALWYDSEGKKYEGLYKTPSSAAYGLVTTIEDYCRFGLYVMNGAGLSPALFREMLTPQSNLHEHGGQGLGWFVVNGLPNGEYAIHHAGGSPGIRAVALFLPRSRRGVVVFTNGDSGMVIYNSVIKDVFDIGKVLADYVSERPNMPATANVPDEVLERYVGRYQHADGKVRRISRRGDTLVLSGGGWPTAEFHPQAENKFFMREMDIQLEFVTDGAGPRVIVSMNGNKISEGKRLE